MMRNPVLAGLAMLAFVSEASAHPATQYHSHEHAPSPAIDFSAFAVIAIVAMAAGLIYGQAKRSARHRAEKVRS